MIQRNTLYYLMDDSEKKAELFVFARCWTNPRRRVNDVQVDYTGFEIPDEFVVGYGLDYASEISKSSVYRSCRRSIKRYKDVGGP